MRERYLQPPQSTHPGVASDTIGVGCAKLFTSVFHNFLSTDQVASRRKVDCEIRLIRCRDRQKPVLGSNVHCSTRTVDFCGKQKTPTPRLQQHSKGKEDGSLSHCSATSIVGYLSWGRSECARPESTTLHKFMMIVGGVYTIMLLPIPTAPNEVLECGWVDWNSKNKARNPERSALLLFMVPFIICVVRIVSDAVVGTYLVLHMIVFWFMSIYWWPSCIISRLETPIFTERLLLQALTKQSAACLNHPCFLLKFLFCHGQVRESCRPSKSRDPFVIQAYHSSWRKNHITEYSATTISLPKAGHVHSSVL